MIIKKSKNFQRLALIFFIMVFSNHSSSQPSKDVIAFSGVLCFGAIIAHTFLKTPKSVQTKKQNQHSPKNKEHAYSEHPLQIQIPKYDFSSRETREEGLQSLKEVLASPTPTISSKSLQALNSLKKSLQSTLNVLRVQQIEEQLQTYDPPSQIRHARIEYFSHLPYKLTQIKNEDLKSLPGLPFLTQIGTIELSTVTPLETEHPGINGFIVRPQKVKYHNEIIITFTGTQNHASQWRDAEGVLDFSTNAGYKSIIDSQDLILQQIWASIDRQTSIPYTIIFAGHSLGGADAQHIAESFLQSVIKKSDENPETFYLFKKISIYVSNSAGIPLNVATQSLATLEKIKQLNIKNNHTLQLQFSAILIDGDGVQLTGEGTLWQSSHHDHIHIEVFKIHYFSELNSPKWIQQVIKPAVMTGGFIMFPLATLFTHMSSTTIEALRKTITSHRLKYYAHSSAMQISSFAKVEVVHKDNAIQLLNNKIYTIDWFKNPLTFFLPTQEPHAVQRSHKSESSTKNNEWEVLHDPWEKKHNS